LDCPYFGHWTKHDGRDSNSEPRIADVEGNIRLRRKHLVNCCLAPTSPWNHPSIGLASKGMTTRPLDFDYGFIWALSAGTGAGITLKSDKDSDMVPFNNMLREFYLFQVEYIRYLLQVHTVMRKVPFFHCRPIMSLLSDTISFERLLCETTCQWLPKIKGRRLVSGVFPLKHP